MTYSAPKFLNDDSWFGQAVFSSKQKEYKLAYEESVTDNLLLDDTYSEVKNIHQVMYNIATESGKITTQLDPLSRFGGGSENYQESSWLSVTNAADTVSLITYNMRVLKGS